MYVSDPKLLTFYPYVSLSRLDPEDIAWWTARKKGNLPTLTPCPSLKVANSTFVEPPTLTREEQDPNSPLWYEEDGVIVIDD